MQWWLEIINGTEKGKKMELSSEAVCIGRDFDVSQFPVTGRGISRIHAKLTILPDGNVQIEDCGSTNGTYFKDSRIEGPVFLSTGDVFQVGSIQIKVYRIPESIPGKKAHPQRGTEDHTRVLSARETISIGRDPSNDFVLNHPMVSRKHARIEQEAGKYILYDLNSTNGTFVNGKRVEGSEVVIPGSVIQICSYRYVFDGQAFIEYDETSGRIKIEAVKINKTVTLPSKEKKNLLTDINLVIEPQKFVAILGGSGSGKSTLMGALTGMRPATSGEILVNGRDFYKEYDSFRSMIGYVPQQDIVHESLTVKDVLTYSARLRMPDDTSREEIEQRVEEVMISLDLGQHREVLVKNLSGGQRKRVSIGVELLTKPSLFFLDEPTSGLDPGLEKVMMELLRELTDQGRTIILVTHATFNIDMCDMVILLAENGQLAFYGTPEEALSYFGARDFAEIYKKISTQEPPQGWKKAYMESPLSHGHVKSKLTHSSPSLPGKKRMEEPIGRKVKTSSLRQWWTLTRRYAHIMVSDRKNTLLLFLQPLLIAALIVMVFSHSKPIFNYSDYETEELQVTEDVVLSGQMEEVMESNQGETRRRSFMINIILSMILSGIWLGMSNTVREIVKEMHIYMRERLINLQIAPYLLSKITVMSIVILFQTVIFVTIISYGLNLPNYWGNFAAFFLIALASVLMGLSVSAISSDSNKATSAAPLLLIPQLILSGTLVPIEDISPEFIKYIFYLAISKWGYELIGGAVVEVNSRVALDTPVEALNGDMSSHWFVLMAFVIVLYVISTLALWRKDQVVD